LGHFRPIQRDCRLVDVRFWPKSTGAGVEPGALPVIQAPKRGLRIVRYELADYEWSVIKPMLRGGFCLKIRIMMAR
jgi:hypothetical protein